MNTLKAYLELIRYPLFAIPIAATLPGALIASEGEWNWRVGLTLLVALLGYFAGMMKNDYFHREQDALVNPDRPLFRRTDSRLGRYSSLQAAPTSSALSWASRSTSKRGF